MSKDGRVLPQISIAAAADKLAANLSEIQDVLSSFYDEEQILYQAGIDVQNQEFNIKYINDAILHSISRLQQHLNILNLKNSQQS